MVLRMDYKVGNTVEGQVNFNIPSPKNTTGDAFLSDIKIFVRMVDKVNKSLKKQCAEVRRRIINDAE